MGDPDQTGGGAGAGGSVEVPVKMGKADALASRFDKAAAALAKISPDAQDVIPIGKLRDALLNKKRRR
jgi:hypothetical protein